MSQDLSGRIEEAARFLRGKWGKTPRAGVILGTGLGSFAARMQVEARVPYEEIPHFSVSTVESHAGELLLGRIGGHDCVVMSGRLHFYEGYSMEQVTFPVRVMRALGAPLLLVSNAVGGLNPLLRLGDIFVTTDHINLMGANPLIGPNDERLGPRFPDMSEPYTRAHVDRLEAIALEERIPIQRGVFVAVAGPNLETRAEYRFLRGIGADVVGMSLIPEVLVAVHGGMEVAALSVVTDLCLPDALEAANIERILKVAADAEPRLTRLVERFLGDLA
ncbi:MAG: purine-nucleoside phosphorylase [Candidatus Eisenbacteria bacterium]